MLKPNPVVSDAVGFYYEMVVGYGVPSDPMLARYQPFNRLEAEQFVSGLQISRKQWFSSASNWLQGVESPELLIARIAALVDKGVIRFYRLSVVENNAVNTNVVSNYADSAC